MPFRKPLQIVEGYPIMKDPRWRCCEEQGVPVLLQLDLRHEPASNEHNFNIEYAVRDPLDPGMTQKVDDGGSRKGVPLA